MKDGLRDRGATLRPSYEKGGCLKFRGKMGMRIKTAGGGAVGVVAVPPASIIKHATHFGNERRCIL
jgi:hypothetical protein